MLIEALDICKASNRSDGQAGRHTMVLTNLAAVESSVREAMRSGIRRA